MQGEKPKCPVTPNIVVQSLVCLRQNSETKSKGAIHTMMKALFYGLQIIW